MQRDLSDRRVVSDTGRSLPSVGWCRFTGVETGWSWASQIARSPLILLRPLARCVVNAESGRGRALNLQVALAERTMALMLVLASSLSSSERGAALPTTRV